MGCLFSKPSPNSADRYELSSVNLGPTTEQVFSQEQSRIQLYTPIYVATTSHDKIGQNDISFEEGDEMEFVKEINSSQIEVIHLRTGATGTVLKSHVKYETDTPLRLGIKERGTAQQCLLQYNINGAYFVRRSETKTGGFVLSVIHFNEEHRASYDNYLILTNPSKKYFHFSLEKRFEKRQYPSLKRLVDDRCVRELIPLTEVLPIEISFEEEMWKIPFKELRMGSKIGQGHFGDVYSAVWHKAQREINVAAKKLRTNEHKSEIQREIETMKKLTNENIVTLYGIAENPDTKEIYIISQLMENGDLKSWLKKSKTMPDERTVLRYARSIVLGMIYLEVRNYVHRDLACRNVLLAQNGTVVKIADLGLSLMISKTDSNMPKEARTQALPVRSLAPEVLARPSAYSIKSDVWAFGILLIEIWQKGEDPYGSQKFEWIKNFVSSGNVHSKPAACPAQFYESIIMQCLKFLPADRPSFAHMRRILENWTLS